APAGLMAAETSMPSTGLVPGRARRRVHVWRSLFLQLPLKDLDLLGQRHVIAHQAFDLAHGMQDSGVVASTKAPTDFGQRAQGQGLCEIHRHLSRTYHVSGPP